MLMRLVDWLFRDRRTGRVVVAQWPNLPLWIFIAASSVGLLVEQAGPVGIVLRIVAAIALAIWAGDEVVRGVNPWRRLLGAGVLIGMATQLV